MYQACELTKLYIIINLMGTLIVTYFGPHVSDRGMTMEWQNAQHRQRDDNDRRFNIDRKLTTEWQVTVVYLPTVQESQCSFLHFWKWEINTCFGNKGAFHLPDGDLNVWKHILQSPNSTQCLERLRLWWHKD